MPSIVLHRAALREPLQDACSQVLCVTACAPMRERGYGAITTTLSCMRFRAVRRTLDAGALRGIMHPRRPRIRAHLPAIGRDRPLRRKGRTQELPGKRLNTRLKRMCASTWPACALGCPCSHLVHALRSNLCESALRCRFSTRTSPAMPVRRIKENVFLLSESLDGRCWQPAGSRSREPAISRHWANVNAWH